MSCLLLVCLVLRVMPAAPQAGRMGEQVLGAARNLVAAGTALQVSEQGGPATPCTLDVQTNGDVLATQTAGVLEVGVCKERTYRRLLSPSSRLNRPTVFASLWMKYSVHYAVPLMSSYVGSYSAHGAGRACRVWSGLIVVLLVYLLLLLSPLGLQPVHGWLG